ncbi:MAG: hypothetical protein HY075_12075, partial [Deltaproteobacteria bacterium]|nr:hypothetical protein [Deltaproteobacteria bacterium]
MWGTFRGAFVALTFVVAATGLAATKHSKIVLSAERDIHGFQAQQALVYGEDSLTFSRNSNFLCAPSDEVLLGVFHAPYEGERETERKYVEEIAARLPAGPASAAPARNPHGVKYFIGPRELVGRDANARTVERIV